MLDTISFRHFVVTMSPVGINKQVKRVIKAKIPNLSKMEDISELLEAPVLSDSEVSLSRPF